MKKIITLILVVLFIVPLIVSCGKDASTQKNVTYIEGYDFVLTADGTDFVAKQINSSPEGDNIVIYTRDYKRDNAFAFVLGEKQEKRCALTVQYTFEDGVETFEVVEKNKYIESANIPYNGFVMSIPESMLNDVDVSKGDIVTVKGYGSAVGSYETHNFAVVAPTSAQIATRRIYYVNPEIDFEENKIYCVNSEFSSKNISVDNLVVELERGSGNNYTVSSVEKKDKISASGKNSIFLIFTGEFNIAYANNYMKNNEKVKVSMLDSANAYIETPAVRVGETIVPINIETKNQDDISNDGVYLFDCDYSANVTPAVDKERVDIAIIDGVVADIETDKRCFVPDANGIILTFVGSDAVGRSKSFKIGMAVDLFYLSTEKLSHSYIQIGDNYFPVDKFNTLRAPEGVTVLYDEGYGASTGSNEYGTEIAIKDNKVTSVKKSVGDMLIPKGGYVLSIHKSAAKSGVANRVNVGDDVTMFLSGTKYNVTSLEFADKNSTRHENTLIVYDGKDGKTSSGTNAHGYEIAVDAEGNAVDHSYNGNLTIPKGGFVVSGHGTMKDALVKAFSYGEKIFCDDKSKAVTIIETPSSRISNIKFNYEQVSDKLEEAKKSLKNINYGEINNGISLMEDLIEEAEIAYNEYNYEKVLENAEKVLANCNTVRYSMIESKGVENRAVWYRALEKSDAEVTATIEKLKKLNVNAVYLETWYQGYCIGKEVDVPGITTHANNGDYDVLEGFVRIAHENGIEVHGWVHDFFVGYFGEGYSYYNPTFAPENYEDKYLIDRNGEKHFYYASNNNYFVFLNPFDRECRDMVLDIYEQLVTKYDIDGLHLDYIRFPELNYGKDDFGYNQDIIDAFAKETGITADPRTFEEGTAQHNAWIEFRCNIITSFMGEVYDMVRANKPDLWLSAATYPDIPDSKKNIAQDVASFVAKGYLDEIFSMSYGVETSIVMQSVNSYLKVTDGKIFYTAGIAAFMETTPLNFAYQLTDVTTAGTDGVSIFALEYIRPSSYQDEIVNGAFRDPAVQTYKLSLTTSAQMSYIMSKLENINSICTVLNEDNFATIRSECEILKIAADAFDFENATNAQKIKYCNETVAKLEAAKSRIISKCGDNAETNVIVKDFDRLSYWLELSASRLENR